MFRFGPCCAENVDSLKRGQRRATEMIQRLGSLPFEERLRKMDLFSLEKGRLEGDLLLCSGI